MSAFVPGPLQSPKAVLDPDDEDGTWWRRHSHTNASIRAVIPKVINTSTVQRLSNPHNLA